jgi:hypothetical protein
VPPVRLALRRLPGNQVQSPLSKADHDAVLFDRVNSSRTLRTRVYGFPNVVAPEKELEGPEPSVLLRPTSSEEADGAR